MKIAILSNTENSFVKPLAEGLQRMLTKLNIESCIFPQGLVDVRAIVQPSKDIKTLIAKPYKDYRFNKLISQLKAFDAIIVVGHMPTAFMNYFMRDASLRRLLPQTPIVLYDLVYLPTRGSWMEYLKKGNPKYGITEGGHFGMERYDYYLCVSVVSEFPLSKQSHPYALIGVNLDDETLYPKQGNEFVALLDFQRPDHLEERNLQIEALRETGTKYIELSGSYPIHEIREIYRKCSLYFLAHRESFGLPICELQACGSYVFTPYAHWCPSHCMKEDLSVPGSGTLSSNFVIYDNNKQKLIQEILRIKSQFNPQSVRNTFFQNHSQLFYGDTKELERFLDFIDAGKINNQSHKNYLSIT